ncbi:MAG TPA: thiol-disulfide oxidoreductase DCC family protein [Elusimicrobiota bacterium]|jgi:predicted DCC family thiol-disulfide oxidoreductase YuxK|nr:thiol-disulfide oxidoreductase DCC family protein [Elusimicrobiota bacterium]
MEGPLLLFDGVCNLCEGWVRFVLARDRGARFRFAAFQSKAGAELAARFGLGGALETMALVEDGACSARSTAALRILRDLGWPWALLYAFIVVPRPLRDAVYDWVARNRYRWFGKKESCLIPTPEIRARFLE